MYMYIHVYTYAHIHTRAHACRIQYRDIHRYVCMYAVCMYAVCLLL